MFQTIFQPPPPERASLLSTGFGARGAFPAPFPGLEGTFCPFPGPFRAYLVEALPRPKPLATYRRQKSCSRGRRLRKTPFPKADNSIHVVRVWRFSKRFPSYTAEEAKRRRKSGPTEAWDLGLSDPEGSRKVAPSQSGEARDGRGGAGT